MYQPTLAEVRKLKKKGNLVPVWREIIADLETPVSAYLKIARGPYSFLLESVEGGQRLARYSFIGTEPFKVIRTTKADATDPLPLVEAEMKKSKLVELPDLPRFCGGAVGYLAYETVNRFEELASPSADPLDLPESLFMLTDTMLVFDHVLHKIKVLSHVRLDGDIDQSYQEAVDKIESLINRLSQPLALSASGGSSKEKPPQSHPIASNVSKAQFVAGVSKIKEYITEGECIQVVLSQRLAQPTDATPFAIYRALRTINPSPYMYYLNLDDFQIIGASPEMLVRADNGVVTTRPLAGTRQRGKDAAEDAALEAELRRDEKERAEHIMLVDLGRNDIGRVSEPGSVVVSDLMDVEKYSHVMHLVTNVDGKLRPDMTAFDALRACFPAGTVSGAPKIRAMQIIAELEPEKRGAYAGAVGYFSFSGNMDMAIAIRTMVMKRGMIYTQAGAGIVYDSVPEREYEESMNKAKASLAAITQAQTLEMVPRRVQ